MTFYHLSMLFLREADLIQSEKPLIMENCDEILFYEPTQIWVDALLRLKFLSMGTHKHDGGGGNGRVEGYSQNQTSPVGAAKQVDFAP